MGSIKPADWTLRPWGPLRSGKNYTIHSEGPDMVVTFAARVATDKDMADLEVSMRLDGQQIEIVSWRDRNGRVTLDAKAHSEVLRDAIEVLEVARVVDPQIARRLRSYGRDLVPFFNAKELEFERSELDYQRRAAANRSTSAPPMAQASTAKTATEAQLRRTLEAAQTKSEKAMDARRRLPPGASRAKVTTANARWSRAAEARDRAQNALDDHLSGQTIARPTTTPGMLGVGGIGNPRTAPATSSPTAMPAAPVDGVYAAAQTPASIAAARRAEKREAAANRRALAVQMRATREAAKRDAAAAKVAAQRDAKLKRQAALKARRKAQSDAKKAKAVERRAKVKAKALAKRAKIAARKKPASSCAGSVAANLKRAEADAAEARKRLEVSVKALEKRHAAAAERLRSKQRAAEVKLEGLMAAAPSMVARRLLQRRLARLRKSLATSLGILEREYKADLKALPRKVDCSILGKGTARQVVESLCGASCHLGLPGGVGGAETLVTLQTGRGALKVVPARFVLTSAASLIPSHDAQSFYPRNDYPEDVQERRYDADQGEQLKVMDISSNMQPGLIANTNVGAVDGTPVAVNGVGVMLGGNGRTMGVQRAYLRGNNKLAEYLARYPSQFGFTAEQVKAIKDPVVVRVIDAPRSEWPRLVRDLNVSLTQAMDAATEAVAQARHFPPDVVKILAGGLADAEIGDWLRSRASLPLVGALERSGFLTRANRARYLKDGLLSADARTALERQLVAALVPDAALLERLGPEVNNALTRSAPFWLGAAAAGGGWDVHQPLRAALQDLAELRSDKQCLAQWQQQSSMVPRSTRRGTIGETLLQVLDLAAGKPVVFTRIARAFYAASTGGGLFGSKDPMAALVDAANEANVKPEAAASRRRCAK